MDAVLSQFGLVAYPRLLLLVEGETELIHLPRLLEEFASGQPEFIRVQWLGGDSVNPQLLARYVVTPRLGDRLGDGWLLDAPLTAMIAIDQEGDWEAAEQRAKKARNIRKGIRKEVQLQGGDIDNDTLDFLIHIRTWGPAGCFELANFTDKELLDGLVATTPKNHLAKKPSRDEIADLIAQVHQGGITLDTLIGRCRTSKPLQLWPVLREKAEREIKSGTITTPVVQVLLYAVQVARKVHPQVRALRDPR
jgi:hypothetical protein